MTYEETLEIIEKHATAVIRGTSKNTLGEALEIASETIKKQIPKKPVLIKKNKLFVMVACPVCDCLLGSEYCWRCGQAIDLSEVEK